MKTFAVLLCLVVAGAAFEETMKTILKSPRSTLQLYKQFKAKEHLKFSSKEDRKRFRQFKKSAKLVADLNEHSNTVKYAVNFFSTMSKAEKAQYTGLNITGHFAHKPKLSAGLQSAPASKLWTEDKAVTKVQNQGGCGSCWSFGAIAGLETRYKVFSGKLRKFAEQEYLDCVYEGTANGCDGGWPDDCYTYSKNKRAGQLSSQVSYPYKETDGTCKFGTNALIAYRISGFTEVGGTEAENIAALAQGSLSVAFEVTDNSQQYSSGIMKDTTCSGSPNHAVAAVGYTPEYVLAKNSWGDAWGEGGFIRFARNHHNCGLFQYSSYPSLTGTGYADTNAEDAAADYTPGDNSSSDTSGGGSSTCVDLAIDCDAWMCEYDSLKSIMQEWCQKTCGYCTDGGSSGECASGTIRCSDGVCRHEHMC
ncbi:hypothetical protein ACHWQZ_G017823 [Mnemiopsis leidyi]